MSSVFNDIFGSPECSHEKLEPSLGGTSVFCPECDRIWRVNLTGIKLQTRPVAWRLKDFADGWIIFQDEAKAAAEAEQMGGTGIMQGLYVRDGQAAEMDGWQLIATSPDDGSAIYLSDGEEVWAGVAHKDGSLKLPSRTRCKFWMPRYEPKPPKVGESST